MLAGGRDFARPGGMALWRCRYGGHAAGKPGILPQSSILIFFSTTPLPLMKIWDNKINEWKILSGGVERQKFTGLKRDL
jgi:hypothetical protein